MRCVNIIHVYYISWVPKTSLFTCKSFILSFVQSTQFVHKDIHCYVVNKLTSFVKLLAVQIHCKQFLLAKVSC